MTSPADLTAEQLRQRDLVTAMGMGMLKGLVARGRNPGEAEIAVRQTLDHRVKVAGQLVAIDLADQPEEGRPQRVKNLGRLFEAVIHGAVAKGQSAGDALNGANAKRDALLVSARGMRDQVDGQLVDVAVALKAGVLQGMLVRGDDFERANQHARQVEDNCLAIARRLQEINQSEYPQDQGEHRLRGVGQLFAAAVAGSLSQGREPRVILTEIYTKHTALFKSVQRTIEDQLNLALTDAGPRPSLGEALGVHRPATPSEAVPGTRPTPYRPG